MEKFNDIKEGDIIEEAFLDVADRSTVRRPWSLYAVRCCPAGDTDPAMGRGVLPSGGRSTKKKKEQPKTGPFHPQFI